jgi:hypothetical protein
MEMIGAIQDPRENDVKYKIPEKMTEFSVANTRSQRK